MKIRVLLFGPLAEMAGVGELDLELAEGARVTDLGDALGSARPGLSGRLDSVAYAVNAAYAAAGTALTDGDEVALIPPVSGG